MTTTINASTSSGLITTPDNSGAIALQNAGVTSLTLDASGRPLTPLRTAFYAKKTGVQTVPSGTVITFDTAITNIGSAYSTSTNTFTAPVAGFYSLTAKIWVSRNGLAYFAMNMFINGSILSGAGAYTDASGVSSGNLTYIISLQYYLNVNDAVQFKTDCPAGNVIIDNSGYFCGFLVG